MPTSQMRKLLDLKQWQPVAPPLAAFSSTSSPGQPTTFSFGPDQQAYVGWNSSQALCYDPSEDSWGVLAYPTSLATWAAGASLCWHPAGPTGTASAGTSTTITTTTTVAADLSARSGLYFRIRITSGTGAGQERLISSATFGGNSVVTVTSAWTTTPDATSVYQLFTGRVWVIGGGTLASGSLRWFDYATQTLSSALSITGLAASFTTDAVLCGTPSLRGWMDASANYGYVSSTATAGGSTTLTDSAQSWTTNAWANSQVRITSGTGAGQVRTVASNTATALTVSSAWTTNPDATSVYLIEGNDDTLYLAGNGAVTLYKYSISGNSWSTLTPGTARAVAPSSGTTLHWGHGVASQDWSGGKPGARLYSFRGNNTVYLDYYDIPSNAWVASSVTPTHSPAIGMGYWNSFVYDQANYIYVQYGFNNSYPAPWYRFDLRSGSLEAATTNPYPQSQSQSSYYNNRAWMAYYADSSGSPMRWLYHVYSMPNNPPAYRCLIY